MRALIFILIIIGCFTVGYLAKGAFGVLCLFMCFLSFILGISVYSDVDSQRALSSELIEIKKKYYELKYAKGKVE